MRESREARHLGRTIVLVLTMPAVMIFASTATATPITSDQLVDAQPLPAAYDVDSALIQPLTLLDSTCGDDTGFVDRVVISDTLPTDDDRLARDECPDWIVEIICRLRPSGDVINACGFTDRDVPTGPLAL